MKHRNVWHSNFNYLVNSKQTDKMCRIRQDIGNKNKIIILEFLYKLQRASPKQIENFLNYKKDDNIHISIRTIKRILKEFKKSNVVKSNKKGIYFICHDEFKYIKDSPNSFAKYFLGSIKSLSLNYKDQDIQEFLSHIGSLILFYFLQSYGEDTVETHNNTIDINGWLNRVFPINNILDLFINIYLKKNNNNNCSKILHSSSCIQIDPQFQLKLEIIFNKLYHEIYETLEIAIICFNYDSQIVYYNKTLKKPDFKTVTNGIKININTADFNFKVKAIHSMNNSGYSLLPFWILEHTVSSD